MAYLESASARNAANQQIPQALSVEEGEWPQHAIREFALRMGDHGHCVSRTFMNHDRQYAVEQLAYAHTLADPRLRELAMALFRHFEQTRPGLQFQA
jgi:hypothetical protein